MRLTLRLAMTLIVLAGPIESAAAERCNDSHEVVTTGLRDNMIGNVRLNGQVVTDVLLKGLCTQGVVTRSGRPGSVGRPSTLPMPMAWVTPCC